MSVIGYIQGVVLNRLPRFMRNPNLARIIEVAALQIDGALDQLRNGLRQSNPLLCDEGMLPVISRDRSLPLYATEPVPSRRYRLAHWWQLHRGRGSHHGEIEHVRPYFLGPDGLGPLPVFWIVFQDGDGDSATWIKCDAQGAFTKHVQAPSNFEYDGHPERSDRFFVFIEMDGSAFTAPNTYDDGHEYDDGEVYDAGGANPFTSPQASDVASMCAAWNGVDVWCAAVILVWGTTIDPTATPVQDAAGWWNLPAGKWGSTVDPSTGLGTRPPYMTWILDDSNV